MFNEALVVQKKIDTKSEDSMLTDKEFKNFVHYPGDRIAEHLETNPKDKKTVIYIISFYRLIYIFLPYGLIGSV